MSLFVHDLPEEIQSQLVDKTDRQLYKRTKYTWCCPVHGEYEQELRQKLDYGRGCNRCARSKIASESHNEGKITHEGTDMKMRARRYQDTMTKKRKYPEWFIDMLYYEEDKEKARSGELRGKDEVTTICEEGHIVSGVIVCNRIYQFTQEKRNGCPECDRIRRCKGSSIFENEVGEVLSDYNPVQESRNLIKSPDGVYMELDWYIDELKLAVECNGEYYHTEGVTPGIFIGYHQWKTDRCAEQGIKLLHIWYKDWCEDRESCINLIKETIEERKSSLCQN